VEQGGGTVFPKLQQIFNPQPGMAVFWYNLHDDGTPNNQTLHGACPVLVGSKWGNFYIFYKFQFSKYFIYF